MQLGKSSVTWSRGLMLDVKHTHHVHPTETPNRTQQYPHTRLLVSQTDGYKSVHHFRVSERIEKKSSRNSFPWTRTTNKTQPGSHLRNPTGTLIMHTHPFHSDSGVSAAPCRRVSHSMPFNSHVRHLHRPPRSCLLSVSV